MTDRVPYATLRYDARDGAILADEPDPGLELAPKGYGAPYILCESASEKGAVVIIEALAPQRLGGLERLQAEVRDAIQRRIEPLEAEVARLTKACNNVLAALRREVERQPGSSGGLVLYAWNQALAMVEREFGLATSGEEKA